MIYGLVVLIMIEFGKHSPVGISCADRVVTLYDLDIPTDEIALVHRFFDHWITPLLFSKEERKTLYRLDKYLDLPLVQAVFDERTSFDSFRRLIEIECTLIPSHYY